jgi:VWFA-related protein
MLLPAQEAISMLALDRQSQPVPDLKADEIQLFDNGQRQPMASFGHLSNPSASHTAILYDLLNIATGARGNVPRQIAQAMQQVEGKASIHLYLLAADGVITPVGGAGNIEMRLDNTMYNISVIRPKHLDPIGARVKATYEAIGELYKTMAAESGRKTIVWITHGVPTSAISTSGTPVDYMPTLKKFASGLGREQVVIYPVQQTVRADGQPNDSSRDTLRQFADLTGGRLYPNGTIGDAVTEAIRDTAASYVLTYTPKSDGKFHALRVTCTRPGTRIQTRQGYFADSR